MTLRLRIPLVLLALVAAFLVIHGLVQQRIILSSFAVLEEKEAKRDMERFCRALANEVTSLCEQGKDWSEWDDSYRFVMDRNEAFIASNLTDQFYVGARLDFVSFCNTAGDVVWGEHHRHDQDGVRIAVVTDLRKWFGSLTGQLLDHKTTDSHVSGIVRTPSGLMLVTAQPIIRSNYSGPIHGTLIFGRLLEADEWNDIARRINVEFRVWTIGDPSMSTHTQAMLAELNENVPYRIDVEDSRTLRVYAKYPDLAGEPVILVRGDIPRDVPPGDTIDLSIPDMVAPMTEGTYYSYWMLAAPDGARIGYGPGQQWGLGIELIVSNK